MSIYIYMKRSSFSTFILACKSFISHNKKTLLTLAKHGSIISVFLFLLLIIHRNVYSLVLNQDAYDLSSKELTITSLPEWLKKELGTSRITIKLQKGTNILASDCLKKIKDLIESQAIVKKVVKIKREFPNKLEIELEIRRPLFAIKKDKYYLIDEDMVLVAITDSLPEFVEGPYISGVKSPVVDIGQKWNPQEIKCAVEIVNLIRQNSTLSELDILAVDMSNFDARQDKYESHIVFILKNGAKILWGCAPEHDSVSVEQKIENLKKILTEYPMLLGLCHARVYLSTCPSIKELRR